MSDERIFIAKTIANKLHTAEDAIDAAIADAAIFTAGLPEARKQAKISAVVGQDVFECAAAMMASLTEARRHAVELHNRLDAVRVQIGIKPIRNMGAYKPLNTTEAIPSSMAA